MKLFGNFEFRNKNTKPRDYHKVRKHKKSGIVVLEITKTYFPECYCDNCSKLTTNQQIKQDSCKK